MRSIAPSPRARMRLPTPARSAQVTARPSCWPDRRPVDVVVGHAAGAGAAFVGAQAGTFPRRGSWARVPADRRPESELALAIPARSRRPARLEQGEQAFQQAHGAGRAAG